MAYQNPQGRQLDIQSVAGEIAADPTAIGSIATGVTTDPGAEATLDLNYLRRDGTGSMTAALDVGLNNIVNVGFVDGRNLSVDGMALDGHIADATLHFTEASIDHANIQNVGSNTHAQIDTHIADMTLHRVINDAGVAVTELWSASKITAELGTKATTAQGALADSAVQPGDNVSGLTNDANYQGQVVPGTVGDFAALDASGNIIDGGAQASDFATAAQGALADTALQSFTETNDLTAAVVWANIPDANVPQSAVTQHQAALSITESQISDLSHTAEVNDLTSAVTWANIPDANVPQSAVTQHQAALSITESQISDLGTYEPAIGFTPADIAGDTFTGDVTVNGTLVGYKDNASCLRTRGPSSPNDPAAGADVQSYMGIFYNDAYVGTGNLRTRAVFGANIEMDLELQAPRQLRLIGVDNTQTDGQIWMASRNDVVINTRVLAEEAAGNQLIIDRVDKGTTGSGNTSNVEVSVNSGELEMASSVKFSAIPQLPVVAKASLSALGSGNATEAVGSTAFVSDDAGSPTFIMAWVDSSNTWVRSDTGVAVA